MLNSIKRTLGESATLKSMSDKVVAASRTVLSAAETEKLWDIVREQRHLVVRWLENEGVELLMEALTRHTCEKLAGYIRELIPFPFRLAIKEEILADFLWAHREQLVNLLQGASVQHV